MNPQPWVRSPTLFVVQMAGHAMRDAGIANGDLLIVDRSKEPAPGDVVVAVLDGELAVKRLVAAGAHLVLHAENPAYPDYVPDGCAPPPIWGVVVSVIHALRDGEPPSPPASPTSPSSPSQSPRWEATA